MGILDRHSDSVSADGACSHRHHQELVGPVPGMQAGVMGLPRMVGKCYNYYSQSTQSRMFPSCKGNMAAKD